MTTKSAHVTDVSIGNLTVEGLMYEDGTFAIAIPQISKLFPESVSQDHATRSVKRALGKGSSEILSPQENTGESDVK